MITPEFLQTGDRVGIVSTARKISREELQPALDILEKWGLEVTPSPNLFAEQHQLAGTDTQRLSDLQGFLDAPEIKAIFCARGGYGTVRIIDQLDFAAFRKNPKWIAGYSDVTVLHNKLSGLGVESLHASMPINFAKNTPESLNSIRLALFGKKPDWSAPPHPFNRQGTVQGEITGGNLSMIYSQTGSPTALQTEGRLLFIEDLDEYLYHIDRMMYNLKRNGYFENIRALLIGTMSDMNDNTIPFGETAEEIIHRHLQDYDFPVAFGLPAGHLRDNRAMIFGREMEVKIEEEGTTLSF